MAEDLRPVSLNREGNGLKIEWSDGVATFTAFTALRAKCPCATCNEERGKPVDPFRILTPQEVAAGAPAPVAMTPVGHYAYQIKWNDGHDTGIYPLALLRALGEQNKEHR
ncbi:hypothetical protein GobsT_44870 [Gemmata obscuriglobus]|uniref:DUF971 domain-containing protein n=1 Tax=Gemmata obscuriglobus TaxID=114 RepID=A0A2Z3GT13_9BACT|nr:DUF971 domain-containing protein [Gemmata obscuriglobus]AWM37529.1 DUF971 domain-containing protein [Gemmata obscuriglobus]QEG29689.1 hypothetical protein GobsT_44870 [Gemmata obscuriglobus]VTS09006.1 Marine sediment metagenome DNA, contig: S01H1_L01765 OS=marine sediment metagenome GN=S01H1_06955 PE=4 SV=1: DUF971 [Gemmata obscuriglobus UQM 2246]